MYCSCMLVTCGRCISIAGAMLEELVWAEEQSNDHQQGQGIGPILLTLGDSDEVTSRESIDL